MSTAKKYVHVVTDTKPASNEYRYHWGIQSIGVFWFVGQSCLCGWTQVLSACI